MTLGSASYSLAAGKTATVKLKLGSKGRSLMRKVTKVRVKLTASPKSGKAASKSADAAEAGQATSTATR